MSPEKTAAIDKSLEVWRQGDVMLDGAPPFVFLADLGQPLSDQAQLQASTRPREIDVVDAPGPGLAVLSQTCNILRSCITRPFVEVSPLVVVQPDILDQVRRGRRPQYAALSGLADRQLVVDLDRTMVIEKAILVAFTDDRVVGVGSEQEARMFAAAVARKRDRAAFPNTFVRAFEPIRQRIVKKHGKNGPDGQFLAGIEQLRVRPTPSWAAFAYVEVLFVYKRESDIPYDANLHIAALLDRLAPPDGGLIITGRAVSMETLPTIDWLESDQLDLEHLSQEGS